MLREPTPQLHVRVFFQFGKIFSRVRGCAVETLICVYDEPVAAAFAVQPVPGSNGDTHLFMQLSLSSKSLVADYVVLPERLQKKRWCVVWSCGEVENICRDCS